MVILLNLTRIGRMELGGGGINFHGGGAKITNFRIFHHNQKKKSLILCFPSQDAVGGGGGGGARP